MNKLTIIGNLTKDPELNTTNSGVNVCNFTVAVNRKREVEGQPKADYFRVSAWRERGDLCAKYLAKGKKVCVIGPVAVKTYTGNDGATKASMEVTADEVEFLSPKSDSDQAHTEPAPTSDSAPQTDSNSEGFTAVETDELPF